MITILEVLQAASTAVLADSNVMDFCSDNFGAGLTSRIGEDASDPATEKDCPVIVFMPGIRPYNIGYSVTEREIEFDVDWCIKDKGKSLSTDKRTLTYRGLLLADQLGQLIFTSLINRFGGDAVRSANYSLDLPFPMATGGMTITLVCPMPLNGTEPALPA